MSENCKGWATFRPGLAQGLKQCHQGECVLAWLSSPSWVVLILRVSPLSVTRDCSSSGMHVRASVLSHFSCVWLFVTPWTPPGSSVHGIFQARIPEWLPCPTQGWNLCLFHPLHWQADSLLLRYWGSLQQLWTSNWLNFTTDGETSFSEIPSDLIASLWLWLGVWSFTREGAAHRWQPWPSTGLKETTGGGVSRTGGRHGVEGAGLIVGNAIHY